MTEDLKQRLRDNSLVIQHPERRRIADRIEQLEAERDELKAALRYLAEAILTRADADYMKRQMDEAVRVLALHGITPPVPYRAAIAKGEKNG